MSADSYSACPRCLARAKVEAEAIIKKVDGAYGQVPELEYEILKREKAAAERKIADLEEDDGEFTFREYHEFYITYDPPTLNVRYSGTCDVCELAHSYQHSEPIVVPPDTHPEAPAK